LDDLGKDHRRQKGKGLDGNRSPGIMRQAKDVQEPVIRRDIDQGRASIEEGIKSRLRGDILELSIGEGATHDDGGSPDDVAHEPWPLDSIPIAAQDEVN
jgi:hypothetical protein